MITILHIAEIILYIILAFNTGYLLLFAIASKFCRPRIYPRTAPGTKFAVLFPAYKEDKVIIPAIYSFLQQDYPRELYDIIVISDQMQESTNEALRQLPVRLLIADYTDSSKAKAMSLAMNATADIPYDAVVIMDADNTAGTSFLSELNPVFQSGARAVQAHRTAKNTNTDIAVLDAASEEINNHIFRKGQVTLGFSSALIGSGMAFDFAMFHEIAPTLKGSDFSKAMEVALLEQNIYTEYLEEIVCYSKKKDNAYGYNEERQRWIASQYSSTFLALKRLPLAFLQGRWDYCNKLVQWIMPSRLLLIGLTVLIAIGMTFLDWTLCFKWYILLLAIGVTFLMAMPEGEIARHFRKAVWAMPILIFSSIFSHIGRFFGKKKKKITSISNHENSD